jgi:hypothetical protein
MSRIEKAQGNQHVEKPPDKATENCDGVSWETVNFH